MVRGWSLLPLLEFLAGASLTALCTLTQFIPFLVLGPSMELVLEGGMKKVGINIVTLFPGRRFLSPSLSLTLGAGHCPRTRLWASVAKRRVAETECLGVASHGLFKSYVPPQSCTTVQLKRACIIPCTGGCALSKGLA